MQPGGQLGRPAIGMGAGLGMGRSAQGGREEAPGLAVGARRGRRGADVTEAEAAAGVPEVASFGAGTMVGHHPRDRDAEAGVARDGGLPEGDGACLFWSGMT